jgi:lambda family phage portal protein
MNKQNKKLELSFLDKAILSVHPAYGLKRIQAKLAVEGAITAGYILPGSSKPQMRSFRPKNATPNGDTLKALPSLRAGSRDLWMNSPIAGAVINRMRTNSIGFGLTLQSRVNADYLGITTEEAERWQRKVEHEWRVWSESKLCDIRSSCNFYELQELAFTSQLLNGDCFTILPRVRTKGFPYSLKIGILEADLICNPNGAEDTMKIAGGVETDENGAPLFYHLKKFKGELLPQTYEEGLATWERIPVFGALSGRRNVLHLFRMERPGQRRGVPLLAPLIEPLKQISRLTEAELQASVVSSLFTVFVTNTPTGALGPGFLDEEKSVPDSDPASSKLYEMGPASIITLDKDQSIEIADPKRPNANFEPFFLALVKIIGAHTEIPAEQVMLSYNASYSASRGAVLEATKMYKNRRLGFARNFNQPIYEDFLEEGVLNGRFEAPGFLEDPMMRAAWARAKWTGPGQGMLNPEAEAAASVLLIKNNLSTHEEEYAERTGNDWEMAIGARAKEQKIIEKLGLKTLDQIEVESKSNPNNSKGTSNE